MSMLGNSFLKADTAEEGLETWVFAKGIEGGFDGEFGHGERTLIEGLFEGIQSFGFLTKLDIENRGAKRRVVGFGWIDGELREFEELLPVTLRAAGGQGVAERGFFLQGRVFLFAGEEACSGVFGDGVLKFPQES